jgi:hypothetical protein
MTIDIDEPDYWWLREIYAVLTAFADAPSNTISRIGGGKIFVADDLANHLDNFLRCMQAKYPESSRLSVMDVALKIDDILTRRSRGSESFDEWFWTNEGFEKHPDWNTIRSLSREFLAR